MTVRGGYAAAYFPAAYVKGSFNFDKSQIIIPGGQYVGSDEEGPEYICAANATATNTASNPNTGAATAAGSVFVIALAAVVAAKKRR